jgi:hypothetical protein
VLRPLCRSKRVLRVRKVRGWKRTLEQARARAIGDQLEAGMTSINDFAATYMSQALPFGGVKDSGFDRFAGVEGLRGCCYSKSVCEDRFPWLMKTNIPPLLQVGECILHRHVPRGDLRERRRQSVGVHGSNCEGNEFMWRRYVMRVSFGRLQYPVSDVAFDFVAALCKLFYGLGVSDRVAALITMAQCFLLPSSLKKKPAKSNKAE